MKSALYSWYKDVTKENIRIQSLKFCISLKLDLMKKLEVNTDLNLDIFMNISNQART